MKFEEYFICDSNGKSNCVIRSFCKLYNEKYEDVSNELESIAKELKCDFNDESVFEKYMLNHYTYKIGFNDDIQIKDLSLDNGNYIVLCYDKKDFYHMVAIMNNVLFDKKDSSFDLYVLKIYKQK